MIECGDRQSYPFLECILALSRDLNSVPARQRHIVDLNQEPGVDDGLILVVQRVRDGEGAALVAIGPAA